MSFWSVCPGPTWFQAIESLNPCRADSSYGTCSSDLSRWPRGTILPPGLRLILLSTKHADAIASLLKDHFSIYPRCRISLTRDRILQGFFLDGWIGVGIMTLEKQLVGCVLSKPLGRLKMPHETLSQSGLVDYFCVHTAYRKQGLVKVMLDELVVQTAKQGRHVHMFLKEGFPLWKLPPLYTSSYLARRRGIPGESKEYFGSMGIGTHGRIESYTHSEYLPLTRFAANLPYELSGDSELFVFTYRGHTTFLCVTDLHHRTVPEGHTIGEISWVLPKTAEVPLAHQRMAVETCVDCSRFDILLLDAKLPHDSKKGWQKDAPFSWYVFNYNPGAFFRVRPYWIV